MSDAPAPSPSNAFLLFAAIGVGLAVVMLVALLTPQLSDGGEVGWVMALVGGLVAAVATYLIGAMRKGPRTTKAEPPR